MAKIINQIITNHKVVIQIKNSIKTNLHGKKTSYAVLLIII